MFHVCRANGCALTDLALISALENHGLQSMGGFAIAPDDDLPLASGTVLLVGPDEPRFWAVFSTSAQYRDGLADPLDRWSRAALEPIARAFGGHALYPFGGPPYHPFHTWALRTGRSWASPIGFLVHDQAGLFASYRGALVLPWAMDLTTAERPCDTCPDQPCKTACPVNAFANGYDVDACKTYLRSAAGTDCMTRGCAARSACPVGQGRRQPAQDAFHMEAFL